LAAVTTGYHDDDAPEVREYASVLGARLRAVRSQQHLSLHGVERKSGGRWKAVVIGSYERGDRAISVQRLAELAAFYGVPVGELLPREQAPAIGTPSATPLTKIVLNPERVAALTDPDSAPLTRFTAGIQRQRGDHRSNALTIRHEDLRTLATIYDMTIADVTDRLVHWQVLAPESLILDGAP
jgi:transcriptional regulator with XRE-family HTH domain